MQQGKIDKFSCIEKQACLYNKCYSIFCIPWELSISHVRTTLRPCCKLPDTNNTSIGTLSLSETLSKSFLSPNIIPKKNLIHL